MTARHPTPNPTPRPSSAVAAFLRGIQRRAILLAWLQAGDRGAAGPAADAAARRFASLAAGLPMEQWPVRYWGLLVDHPALRAPLPGAHWPSRLSWLGDLSNGPRAVLLLRLVAGLEPAEVAAALEVPPAAAHAALRDALPRQADGSHDPLAWQARQEAVREALDALPPAEAPVRPPASATSDPVRAPGPGRVRRTRWLWAGVAACALALAASFLPLPLRAPSDDGAPADAALAERAPLPPSQAAAAPLQPDLVLLAHPDLEQLANAADAKVVEELGLHAWYAARLSREARKGVEGGDAR